MRKTSNCPLVKNTKDRSSVVLTNTNKNTQAEMSYFISAIFNMAKKGRFIGCLLLLVAFSFVSLANAYELKAYKWPQPEATFYVNIAGAEGLWNSSFETAMYLWGVDTIFTYKIFREVYEDPCDATEEGRNGVAFGDTFCGDAWGGTTLAICNTTYRGSEIIQTDIVFNRNESWNVYSTPWEAPPWSGVSDFQRVAVHELGHALGLDHEDGGVETIMRSYVGNITIPQQDDINGVAALYGAACANPPVKVAGNYYDTIQAAYNSAVSGNTLQIQGRSFSEYLLLNRNIPSILEGGYNCHYDTNTGYSTVDGSITISNGTVTIKNLIIK